MFCLLDGDVSCKATPFNGLLGQSSLTSCIRILAMPLFYESVIIAHILITTGLHFPRKPRHLQVHVALFGVPPLLPHVLLAFTSLQSCSLSQPPSVLPALQLLLPLPSTARRHRRLSRLRGA